MIVPSHFIFVHGQKERHGVVPARETVVAKGGKKMKKAVHSSLVAAMLVAGMIASVSAETGVPEGVSEGAPAGGVEGKKGEVRFAIGASYAAGINDVYDFVEKAVESGGGEIDGFAIPVGLMFVGGYRFSFGVEILIDAGPVSLLALEASALGESDTYWNWDVPVGLTAGYAFFTDKSVSPYVRGGVRYHITGGDFSDSSSPGLYVAGGVNFFSNKAVQLQLEVAYDAAEVTYKTPDEWSSFGVFSEEEIEPGGLMVSIRAAF